MVAERAAPAVEPRGDAQGATGGAVEETVGAFEAKTHLSRLLDAVQRGKIITITRRGVPVAVLASPDTVRAAPVATDEDDAERAQQAIAAWVRYRDAQPHLRATVAEILAWVQEGRR